MTSQPTGDFELTYGEKTITFPSKYYPNTFPQPKLDNGSWQCGGCSLWYAPWVKQCNCQQYN